MINSNKIPPYNLEAEQGVLGAALLNKDLTHLVLESLREDDFYKESHSIIFEYISYIRKKNENVDVISVCDWLRSDEKMGEVGGAAYISSLTNIIPTTMATKTYINIIKNKSKLRKIINVSSSVLEGCYSEGNHKDLMEQLEKEVLSVSDKDKKNGFRKISNHIEKVFSDIEQLASGEKKAFGIPTGFRMIDKITAGFCPGDLILIAGRPSMGKTSLAMNIIENMVKSGEPTAIFSLEMSAESLVMRMLSAISRVDSFRLRNGKVRDDDWPKLTRACGMLDKMDIYVDDSVGLSAYDIRARGRRIKADKGISSIWIDYLQLSKSESRSREEEIRIISSECKGMAKELNIPVIALSQLNRECEKRTDKRPMLSDLRDSGSLEQDADIVAFVYRDEVYNTSEDNPNKGKAEFIIRKNRNGPIGTAELVWLDAYTRFENYLD